MRSKKSASKMLRASIVLFETEIAQVQRAIESCLLSTIDVHLTIVDNSPTDSLRACVEAMGVEYLWTGKNGGYGAGHNIALNKSLDTTAAYHLVMNPDVHFGPEVLSALHGFMEANPEVGLVMPRVLYPNQQEQHLCKLLPTPADLLLRRFGGGWGGAVFRERADRYVLRSVDLSTARVVPSLSGCFMFLRISVIREVGLFDERYFLYMEDLDLCRRVAEVSKTVFFPEVSIYHEHARSSYKSVRALMYHMRSAFQYFQKWGWVDDVDRDRLNRAVESEEVEFAVTPSGAKAA